MDDRLTTTPFQGLKKMLRARRRELLRSREAELLARREEARTAAPSPPPDDDEALFLKAMKGVVPLHPRPQPGRPSPSPWPVRRDGGPGQPEDEDQVALERLKGLVSGALPLPVEDTPEFVEGANPGVSPWLSKRLHAGRYSVQGYLDLHGMDSLTALDACHAFFEESLRLGRRCVAVIHGRGLSSPREPVLKGTVIRWLRRGPFRRFVLAYSSAPPWDGGAGVTYVLLSRRPLPRPKGRRRRVSP